MNPSKRKLTVLKQISNIIPRNLVSKLARKHGVDKQSRSFTPWSHVVSLLYAQLSHSISLNDVCDSLGSHSRALEDIRGARPPSRNGLSHANRERHPEMAEELFWAVLTHLQQVAPRFGLGHGYCTIPHRFKRTINAVDSTTIRLFANCLDWAKHRRRKAAAKMHLRLDLQSFLPQFAVVKAANTHDSSEARSVCAGLSAGEIVVFDKAYVEFQHLCDLEFRGVFWVTRAKENIDYEVVGQHQAPKGKILRDETIRLTGPKTSKHYSKPLRLVEAMVKIQGEERRMIFISNNFQWAGSSIAELYKTRWTIEIFFRQIKQTLHVSDFLGYNENAVKWQLWTALLAYVLLRFIAHTREWAFSFPRLVTVLRAVLWSNFDLDSVIKCCGTAGAPTRIRASAQLAYLPGFAPG